MMQINIYDETYDTEKGQGGLAAALVVFKTCSAIRRKP